MADENIFDELFTSEPAPVNGAEKDDGFDSLFRSPITLSLIHI